MSIISSQGGFLIGCRECDAPDCRGCNIYRLATALDQGKFDWAKNSCKGIDIDLLIDESPKGMQINLSRDDCLNAAEFIEEEFFNRLYNLMRAGELDNVGYVRSLIRAMDALYKAAGKEPSGLSYPPEVKDDV
jgi:hypothetical protein